MMVNCCVLVGGNVVSMPSALVPIVHDIVGPGPFEALASGCAFIQPMFSPPHSRRNTVSNEVCVVSVCHFIRSHFLLSNSSVVSQPQENSPHKCLIWKSLLGNLMYVVVSLLYHIMY